MSMGNGPENSMLGLTMLKSRNEESHRIAPLIGDPQTEAAEITQLQRLSILPASTPPYYPQVDRVTLQSDLACLKQACADHSANLESARAYYIDVAQSVAKLMAEAGLIDVRLPRDYRVLQIQEEHCLVKYAADDTPLFIATGQENLYVRLELKLVNGLRPCDIAEFAGDLRQGLLTELTIYVNSRLQSIEVEAHLPARHPARHSRECLAESHSDPECTPLDSRTMQLKSIGRRQRRVAAA